MGQLSPTYCAKVTFAYVYHQIFSALQGWCKGVIPSEIKVDKREILSSDEHQKAGFYNENRKG
jgi:hypothetical protein